MKKENIKVLVKKESAKYSSETLLWKERRYKIVAENDNCYSHLKVFVYTNNGDICQVANEHDIPCYEKVDYIYDDSTRICGNRRNITAAEEYIRNVF